MATMNDIASTLGISKATVSKALSGAADVSETTRKSVLETAVELGYNRIPRSSQAPCIAIFIVHMAYERPDDFGYDLVTGFRKMAEPSGYETKLIPLTMEMQKEIHYEEYMLKHNYVAAFFLGLSYFDPWLEEFKTSHTPAVLFDNKVTGNPNVVHVGIDNFEAFDIMVRRLKKLGHRNIGYLSGPLCSYVFHDRYNAFFRALKKHNLRDNRAQAGDAFYSNECIEEHFPRLLNQDCTAIICSHDTLAQALLIHCQEKGIRIPGDLSIIGIDDLPICRFTQPPLSSIRQDRTELGKSAYYALSCQLGNIHINSLTLHPELMVRASIGRVPL